MANSVDSDQMPDSHHLWLFFYIIYLFFIGYNMIVCQHGPSCSKLTTSLVNDSLKFTSSDKQIC